ncbi:hypothetical protein ACFPC0_11000 [Streptomyces andamanensis]|uniref:Uncharacterized protein n=1 Tax=Streptomyces andamanensis TaxID=1565035 RepID=A0ABV8TCX0_9ACTN
MPTHHRDPLLTCDNCGAATPRPAVPGTGLYRAGWRWRANPGETPLRFAPKTFLVSCPACPPVAAY